MTQALPETPAAGAVATDGLLAEGLERYYGKWRVVSDVSLRVRRGEVVGLLGPNGAGKSTTFHMIVGLLSPNAGTIRLDGRDITDEPVYRRARLGPGLPRPGPEHLPAADRARERAGRPRDHEADPARSARSAWPSCSRTST